VLRKAPVGPVLPDPGTPFQLVHTEDVALALAAAVRGEGEPGVYNLAGAGTVSVADLAHALGWRSVPVPHAGVSIGASIVGLLPLMPPQASWLNAFRVPVVMDTTRAREQLGWKPLHDTKAVLADTARSAREAGLI
jgi:nucleoside-diphosphate-sugar epimerase